MNNILKFRLLYYSIFLKKHSFLQVIINKKTIVYKKKYTDLYEVIYLQLFTLTPPLINEIELSIKIFLIKIYRYAHHERCIQF